MLRSRESDHRDPALPLQEHPFVLEALATETRLLAAFCHKEGMKLSHPRATLLMDVLRFLCEN